MVILGLTLGHDAAVSIVVDGKLVSSISCERIYREKKTSYIDWVAIDYILSLSNLSFDDVDYISIGGYDKWAMVNDFVKIYYVKTENNEYPFNSELHSETEFGYDVFKDNWLVPPNTDRYTQPFIEVNVVLEGQYVKPGFLINHQTAHAASTFYTSPFDKSAVLTLDGSGEFPQKSGSYHYGENDRLELLGSPNTLIGVFYDKMTDAMSLGPGYIKAGTLMGLSSYGKPNDIALKNWQEFIKPGDKISSGDVEYYYIMGSKLAGRPPYSYRPWIQKDSDLYSKKPDGSSIFTLLEREDIDKEVGMNLASSVQYIFEKVVLNVVDELYELTKEYNGGNLCLAGGSFLNCNANYKILKESKFDNIFIYPASSDDGLSAGAALYVNHHIIGVEKQKYTNSEIMYGGGGYEDDDKIGIEYDVDVIAKMISRSKIIAWYQGSSEFGPRALGNRSFIANPTDSKMKDILNSRVKFREWFRPFAPSVLEEYSQEYFDIDVSSPFMLYTCPVKKPDIVPSITHIDGTARVQTVNQEDNPKYYELIKQVQKYTGVPMVLNTSLNINGQPIVETPKEALDLYRNSDIDGIVINNRMIIR
jgi:carbamoyltransferase